MIDTVLKVIDRMIQLLSVRQQNRVTHFKNIIEPMYQDAEVIVKDYMALFTDLIAKLEKEEDIPGVINWIEQRRMDMLPIRIKMRAFLRTFDSRKQPLDRFQRGIWGILTGGNSLVEEGHIATLDGILLGHTVLDLLYLWSQQPISANRWRFLHSVHLQLDAVQQAWKEVVHGYAELKSQL